MKGGSEQGLLELVIATVVKLFKCYVSVFEEVLFSVV